MVYSIEARRNMATLIAEQQPDICHIHNIYTQLSPSILHALAEKRIPTVMTVHDHHLVSPQYNIWAPDCGPDYSRAGILRGTLSRFHKNSYAASFVQVATHRFHRLLRIYEKNVRLFICPSEYMRRRLIAGGFPEDRIRVNAYGMDPEVAKPEFEHEGYFLFVGRLSEEKGVDMVVRLAQSLPELQFKVVGTGPEEERLHRLAHGHDNIAFVGFKAGEDLARMYRGALAVLVPSTVNENFPLTCLEAMAYGKPIVASNAGGIPEVVEDCITGFLVPPTDIRAWIEAVLRLAYDEDGRKRMAHAARLSVETTFHIKHHWDRLMKTYDEAMQNPAM
jgi:glycosyltransferase involved in cell wall biosynthesis